MGLEAQGAEWDSKHKVWFRDRAAFGAPSVLWTVGERNRVGVQARGVLAGRLMHIVQTRQPEPQRTLADDKSWCRRHTAVSHSSQAIAHFAGSVEPRPLVRHSTPVPARSPGASRWA